MTTYRERDDLEQLGFQIVPKGADELYSKVLRECDAGDSEVDFYVIRYCGVVVVPQGIVEENPPTVLCRWDHPDDPPGPQEWKRGGHDRSLRYCAIPISEIELTPFDVRKQSLKDI